MELFPGLFTLPITVLQKKIQFDNTVVSVVFFLNLYIKDSIHQQLHAHRSHDGERQLYENVFRLSRHVLLTLD